MVKFTVFWVQNYEIKSCRYICSTIVGTIPKSNIKIIERGKIDTPNIQIHDRSLSWISTGISIKSGGVKLVLCSQTNNFTT
jgi:hypothetical protein